MGAAAPIAIFAARDLAAGPARRIRVDHPSIKMRRSSEMPRPRCGASTIGSWRRSNPDSTARPPGARWRARSAASNASGRARMFERIRSWPRRRNRRPRYPAARPTRTRLATLLRATLWRATATDPASISPASTRRRSSLAAAIDRIPVPAPISSGWVIRRFCASVCKARRQPRVEGCSPVPNAVAASSAIPIAPAGTPP